MIYRYRKKTKIKRKEEKINNWTVEKKNKKKIGKVKQTLNHKIRRKEKKEGKRKE